MSLKLTIITINFNNVEGLKSTFRSVLNQSYTDFEYIIIDGGSKDGSIALIQSFQNKFQDQKRNVRFKWTSESDTGIYNAMNKGILKSTGEYCLFLNSGDYLADDSVLENVFKLSLTKDVIYGNLITISKGNVIGKIKGKDTITFLDIYSSNIKHQASFIRRDLFEKLGLYDESLKISADWAFFLKSIGINRASFQYMDIDIAFFDSNGMSNNNPEFCRKEARIIIDQFIPKLMQEDYTLLKKYKSIRQIDNTKLGWLLFRSLAKVCKIFSRNKVL